MRRTIQFREYMYIVRKRAGTIAVVTMLAALLSIFVNYYVLKPVYVSTTTLIVNDKPEDGALDYEYIMFNREVVKSCTELVRSKAVAGNVFNEMKMKGMYEDFVNSISVRTTKDTGIIRIAASSKDAADSARIANRLAYFFTSETERLIGIDTVGVIEYAEKPLEPEKPNKPLNIAIGTLFALITAVGWVFLRERMEDIVVGSSDIERSVGLNVIGVVPNFERSIKTYSARNERLKNKQL